MDAQMVPVPAHTLVQILWKMPPERSGTTWYAKWQTVTLPAFMATGFVEDGTAEWPTVAASRSTTVDINLPPNATGTPI